MYRSTTKGHVDVAGPDHRAGPTPREVDVRGACDGCANEAVGRVARSFVAILNRISRFSHAMCADLASATVRRSASDSKENEAPGKYAQRCNATNDMSSCSTICSFGARSVRPKWLPNCPDVGPESM
jgi:hypothetical protein